MKARAKDSKRKEELPKVDKVNVEKVEKAKKKLAKYMKENKLDPGKDYTKHKKHGEVINGYLKIINRDREKIKENTVPDGHSSHKTDKPRLSKKERKGKTSTIATKYDYPKVKEGNSQREMTPDEKKKYRIQMRKQSKGETPKETVKPETKNKVVEKEKKSKKTEKPTKAEKAISKKKKKND